MNLAFKKIRDKNLDKEIMYPTSYYDVVYKSIEELAVLKSKKLAFLENFTAGSIWFLGEMQSNKISQLTYSWIWYNQALALKYDRDDFVLMHWQNAHQHIEYQLQPLPEEISQDSTIKNKNEIEERSKERNTFFYFHCALGALLLYRKKYITLRRIFTYTQSIPPRYVLLPERMGEIFALYFRLVDDFDGEFHFISSKYPFPDFTGMHSDQQVKEQICLYLALLFLRQYSIVPYLVHQKPLELPNPPSAQGEKKIWLSHLPYFKQTLKSILKNTDLLITMQLDFITDEYCESNGKRKPLQLLEDLEKQVSESIESTEVNQDIAVEKKENFINATKRIMIKTFEQYDNLSLNKRLSGETTSNFINGAVQIFDKSSFADSQGVTHLNYDSFSATQLSEKFKRGISESFFYRKTEQYLFNSNDIISVLDKLNIKEKDIAIVGFDYKVEDYPIKVKFHYSESNRQLLGRCLFVIKEADLPNILYNDTNEEYKKNYDLEKLDERFKLYASLIDLNKNEQLHQEIYESGFTGDARKQVLATIFINTEIKWKKDIKCVAIRIASPFREEGILSNLSDVKEF